MGLLKLREGGGATTKKKDEQQQTPAQKTLNLVGGTTGKAAKDVSLTDLTKAGVDPSTAMKTIMDEAQALNTADRAAGNVPKPNTDPRPKVDDSALLTPDLAKQTTAAKAAIAKGDTKGAAQAIMEAGKVVSLPGQTIAPTQAVENATAVAEGRNPVNTASQSGLWGGKVGMPTGVEPLDVIRETATPEQAALARSNAARAIVATTNLGLMPTKPDYQQKPANPPPASDGSAPMTTTVTDRSATGTTAPPMASSTVTGADRQVVDVKPLSRERLDAEFGKIETPAQVAAPKEGFGTFEYNPTAYALDEESAKRLAEQRAAIALDPRLSATEKEYARRALELELEEEGVAPYIKELMAMADESAARSGMFNSGRRLALRGEALGEAQRRANEFARRRSLASRELADARIALAGERGNLTASELDRLRRDDREFQMRERGQQYGEFQDARNFGFNRYTNERDYARRALESDRGFDLNRRQFADQYMPGGVGYASRVLDAEGKAAAINDQYTEGGLGFQSRRADLDTKRAEYNDRYTAGGLGFQSRQEALRGERLENDARVIRNQVADLERQLAFSQDVGKRRQLELEIEQRRKQLDLIDSQIAENQAQAAKAASSGAKAKSPEEEADKAAAKAKKDKVDGLTKTYDISDGAAQVWTDFEEYLSGLKEYVANVPPQEMEMIPGEVNKILQSPEGAIEEAMKWAQKNGLDARDREFLKVMIQVAFGRTGYDSTLQTFRKNYRTPKPAEEDDESQYVPDSTEMRPGDRSR